ncbi:MAG TPA: type II toxin-antitoxin system VapC family toxin [Gaiellaceae bacterium]
MGKFVVDLGAVLELVRTGKTVSPKHKLLAPTLLRSQALSVLHEAVHRGDLPADEAREQLAAIAKMPIRLLGDAVLRRRAWEVATELGWAETYDAEYIALAQVQRSTLVALDARLRRSAEGLVPIAGLDALL